MANEKIFVGSPYTLTIETNLDLSGVDTAQVKYRKPDGTEGTLTSTVSGMTLVTPVSAAVNDLAGQWFFHAAPIFNGDSAPTIGTLVPLEIMQWFYQ